MGGEVAVEDSTAVFIRKPVCLLTGGEKTSIHLLLNLPSSSCASCDSAFSAISGLSAIV